MGAIDYLKSCFHSGYIDYLKSCFHSGELQAEVIKRKQVKALKKVFKEKVKEP